ncbi:MAG: peroxiredoxin [Candidatus Gracilibacteria bacterium]|nr:peroxiredoxin [Candidatus Gracilibacteria bacterium]
MKIDITKIYEVVNVDLSVENKKLGELLNKDKNIIYFYPKDNTPGCSLEALDFTCMKGKFDELGINIIGVSKDSIDSHKKFISNLSLGIQFISDKDLILHKELGVYSEKNNYGKISMGVIRSTFLISKTGEILKEWRNVKAKGHVEKILKEII